ncbi:BrnA antitoxin family protein [Devosia sp. FKR38]|uniref:BrnA antitoxin family protein n=1 Tax=Devosia sp. FKR38 TaxID=2562312 RepID=UPI0010C0E8AB|nr:BrnA antitoxin family protein [Devosia sp. FKR38]
MIENKPDTAASWVDPDDAPELTDDWFARADQHHDGRLVKRGRPPLAQPKLHINIRLDADVVDRLKADGPGWQSRANALLRKAMGL